MDLIEKIGPFVGLAAFIGLAVLAFMIFQQSRDIRRLREWAGRAPERAKEAADASLAAAEARGEAAGEEHPGRFARARTAIGDFTSARYETLDRHLPIDGRILLGGIALALVIAAGVLTSGFGLIGDDEKGKRADGSQEERPKVTVLNATQDAEGGPIGGLADEVASEVVRQAGFTIGDKGDAPVGFPTSVVMYKPDANAKADAARFARGIQEKLGETPIEEMTSGISSEAGGAKIVLVVGADDAGF